MTWWLWLLVGVVIGVVGVIALLGPILGAMASAMPRWMK